MNPEKVPSNEPTKDFYLSNPKSAELREKSIDALHEIKKLIYDPELASNPSEKAVIESSLQNIIFELEKMGISPEMHVGSSEEMIKSDPVTCAEYVAGQILDLANHNIVSEHKAVSLMEEYSEKIGDEARLNENPGNAPRPIVDLHVQSTIINFLLKVLDAK